MERQMEMFAGPDLVKSIADRKAADRKVGERARDEGIRRAADGNQRWISEALAAVRDAAMQYREFTADDIWDDLRATGDDRPRDGRALGPVMRMAAREGICRKTNRVQNCDRKSRHCAPIAIWESLIYRRCNHG